MASFVGAGLKRTLSLSPSHPLSLTLSPSLTLRTMTNTLTLSPSRTNAPLHTPSDVAALLDAFDLDVASVLTEANPKLAKTVGAVSVIHHALPHRALARAIDPGTVATTAPRGFLPTLRALAERTGMVDRAMAHNGCRHATRGCIAACLNGAGHGGISTACANCRGRRTLAMIADPPTYARAMVWALARAYSRAAAQGLPLAFRTLGTDETPWHRTFAPMAPHETAILRRRFGVQTLHGNDLNIAQVFAPMIADGRMIPYEYVKAAVRHADGPAAWLRAGWCDVTASFAADRITACADAIDALRLGFRVAVPIAWPKDQPLPPVAVFTTRAGQTITARTVDGDQGDARWRDPSGCVVLLREKRARGADRTLADRFILPHAHHHTLADGHLELG
jgi:hypothetical protein